MQPCKISIAYGINLCLTVLTLRAKEVRPICCTGFDHLNKTPSHLGFGVSAPPLFFPSLDIMPSHKKNKKTGLTVWWFKVTRVY